MSGSANKIRGAVFGGFNREDVSSYVEKLAKERNEYKALCQKLTAQLEEEKEKAQLESEKAMDTASSLADSAARTVAQLETQYITMREEMAELIGKLRGEMTQVGDHLDAMGKMLDSSDEAFRQMHQAVDELKDTLSQSDNEVNEHGSAEEL